MKVTRDKWKFKDEYYGPLLKFVKDENVTDINFNGKDVWIDDLTVGRYRANVELSQDFIQNFSTRIADVVSESFNQYNPLLEAETDVLRISIVHESVVNTGRSISIRKTPIVKRLNFDTMISSGYSNQAVLSLLKHCVDGKMNALICGLPGAGKTELLKYLTSFIPANDRVITIEDSLEIHYAAINEGKDCVEMKVDSKVFDYVKAIKACLRQNPQWILLSEARSTEVKHLMESMSTGTHCLTTIHTDDVRKVPDRIKNMIQDSAISERIENDVYSFLDLAILVRKKIRGGRIVRFIDQICFFSREEGENVISMVVDDGKIIGTSLPKQIMRKFAQYDITDPFALVNADGELISPDETASITNKESDKEEKDEAEENAVEKTITGETIFLPDTDFEDETTDNEENIFMFTDVTHPPHINVISASKKNK